MTLPKLLRFAFALGLACTAGCGATPVARSASVQEARSVAPAAREPAVEPADTRPEPVTEADADADADDPSHIADPPVPAAPPAPPPHAGDLRLPTPSGRDLRTAPGAEEHAGECCRSSRTCGGLTCARSHFATCQRMCLIRCRPDDRCPPLGGTSGGNPPCGEDGFCPVTPPGA